MTKSSTSAIPYKTRMCNRSGVAGANDPLVSLSSFNSWAEYDAGPDDTTMYSSNAWASSLVNLNDHGGANVYINAPGVYIQQ